MVKQKQKKKSLFSRLTFTVAAIVMAALLCLSYVAMVVNPARAWWMTLFGLMYLPFLLGAVFFFFWGLFRRAWVPSAILLAVILPSIILIGRYFQFNGNPADGSRGDIKMVSYNVGLFANGRGAFKDMPRRELADKTCEYLRSLDADVICLQEFYIPSDQNIDVSLKKSFPGYKAEYYVYTGEKGRMGNVILTRFPVVGRGHIDFDRSTNMAIYADLNVRGTRFRVYNCHFESYNISLSHLVKTIRNSGAVEENGRKMRRSILVRPRQVDEVMANIDACREQAFVVGDFNDNPLSYTYHRLSRDRRDAFVEVGKGFGATHAALWPMLRIDYILYPESLEARWYNREDARFSDHFPIVSSFLK